MFHATIWAKLGSHLLALERWAKTFACPWAAECCCRTRVVPSVCAANAEEKRPRCRVASPFPSKSGLRPKVLLSSRRRSPGCEGYTRSRAARPAPPTYRLELVGILYLTVPTFTVAARTSGRTPDAYDKPPPTTRNLSLSLSLNLSLFLSFLPFLFFPSFFPDRLFLSLSLSLRALRICTHTLPIPSLFGDAHIRPPAV